MSQTKIDVTPDDVEGGHGVKQGDIRFGKTRGTSGLSQYGCTKIMCTVKKEARRRKQERRKFAPP
jgi:hypothetical protein